MTPDDLAALGVRVKPLVWSNESGKTWIAETEDDWCSSYGVDVWKDGRCKMRFGLLGTPIYPSLDLAKAAAEADHAARICAALEKINDDA